MNFYLKKYYEGLYKKTLASIKTKAMILIKKKKSTTFMALDELARLAQKVGGHVSCFFFYVKERTMCRSIFFFVFVLF